MGFWVLPEWVPVLVSGELFFVTGKPYRRTVENFFSSVTFRNAVTYKNI
jgi:hypothetical protein